MRGNNRLFLLILLLISACIPPGIKEGEQLIEGAKELGKSSPFQDTAIYPRVYENSRHDLYLNGRLVDIKEVEVRITNLKEQYPQDAFIFYANDTPATRIPTESKLLPILMTTGINIILKPDSTLQGL